MPTLQWSNVVCVFEPAQASLEILNASSKRGDLILHDKAEFSSNFESRLC